LIISILLPFGASGATGVEKQLGGGHRFPNDPVGEVDSPVN
jgi:hypothetical protein